MMNMKKLTTGLLATTTAGLMAITPIAVHAAETNVSTETNEDGKLSVTFTFEDNAEANDITEIEDINEIIDMVIHEENGKELLAMIKDLPNKDDEEIEADIDFLFDQLAEPQNRVDLIKAALDEQDNLEMTEEEKIEVAEAIGTLTAEDIDNAVSDFIDLVESDEFEEVLNEFAALIMVDFAQDLDNAFDELGQDLIDITAEDILSVMCEMADMID